MFGVKSLLRLYGRQGIIDVVWGKIITEVIWEMRDYWCQWKNDYWGYMGDEGLLTSVDVSGKMITEVIWETRDYWCLLMSVEKLLLRLYGRRIIDVSGKMITQVIWETRDYWCSRWKIFCRCCGSGGWLCVCLFFVILVVVVFCLFCVLVSFLIFYMSWRQMRTVFITFFLLLLLSPISCCSCSKV